MNIWNIIIIDTEILFATPGIVQGSLIIVDCQYCGMYKQEVKVIWQKAASSLHQRSMPEVLWQSQK